MGQGGGATGTGEWGVTAAIEESWQSQEPRRYCAVAH